MTFTPGKQQAPLVFRRLRTHFLGHVLLWSIPLASNALAALLIGLRHRNRSYLVAIERRQPQIREDRRNQYRHGDGGTGGCCTHGDLCSYC